MKRAAVGSRHRGAADSLGGGWSLAVVAVVKRGK